MIGADQGFPQIGSSVVDGQGKMLQPLYQLLITLWTRTGSSQNAVAQGTFSGDVRQFAGLTSKIPQGWLLCDGSIVSRKTYSSLFTAIGTVWGDGDGVSTFQLPDATAKFIIGVGGTLSVGDSGGHTSVTLTTGNLPAHNHGVTDPSHAHAITDPGHTHTDGTPNLANDVAAGTDKTSAIAGNTGSSATGITVNPSATGITIQNTGSGDPVNIQPPYVAMLYIIKT